MTDVRPDELAYAAGYFDGEGSISIVTAASSSTGVRYHRLMLGLSSTDQPPLLWMQERFGGWVGRQSTPKNGHKPARRWQVSGQAAEDFLRQVRPWLIIKAERADVALAFRTLSLTRGYNKLPEGVAEGREELRQQMLALNKRGLPFDSEQEAE